MTVWDWIAVLVGVVCIGLMVVVYRRNVRRDAAMLERLREQMPEEWRP